MGTSQRVVEYFVVQKITKLRVSHYFQNPQVVTYLHLDCKIKNNKHKRLPATNERCLHSMELFHATQDRKLRVILLKDL